MATTHRHMPGVTGLRGIAVALVVAYHLGHLEAGFLGVDVFFVLSGFLITTLLLRDTPWATSEMLRWWGRRIRRLTPAVAVTVLVTAVAFATTSGIAMDGFATLTWWQNWHLIAEGSSYWSPQASPLRHAWSLSIEEQFYLFWPVMVVASTAVALRMGLRSARAPVAVVASVGIVASFAWAFHLAGPVDADLTRIYYGTDTRAGALLLGCVIAAARHRRPVRRLGAPFSAFAVVSGVALVWMTTALSVQESYTYRGGLAAAAALSGVLVVASALPGPIETALSWRPLQWVGVRSYAIYLWSWPTQVYLERHVGEWPRPVISAITVAVSVALASLSLRWVEEPLRHGTSWAEPRRLRRVAWAGGTAVMALVLVVAANSTQLTEAEQLAVEFERLPDPTTAPADPGPALDTAPTTTCPPTVADPGPEWGDETAVFDRSTVEAQADPTGTGCGEITRLLVVGDSTGRGAANALRRAAPEGLEVWDRTELGCGLVAPSSECADWRGTWGDAVEQIRPDVVLVYLRVSDDLVPGPDPDFLTSEAATLRRTEMDAAVATLAAQGARIAWVLPATPSSSFYCEGRPVDSPCDPVWVAQWHVDLRAVAQERNVRLVDVAGWIESRVDTAATDRPDGLHMSGPTLDEHAIWLTEQLGEAR